MSRRRSFTVAREPIELELGGDDFHAPPVIAPAVLGDLMETLEQVVEIQKAQGLSQKEQIEQVLKVLDGAYASVLTPESATLFHERLYSRANPLDLMREVIPALEWLIEEYTDRPLVPSQPSTTGPGDGGTSSTPGASAEDSTPSTSLSTVSATPSTPPSTT